MSYIREKYQIEYQATDDGQWYVWELVFNSEEDAIKSMWNHRKLYPTMTFRVSKVTTTTEHKVIAE
jgi:hypothetical protein